VRTIPSPRRTHIHTDFDVRSESPNDEVNLKVTTQHLKPQEKVGESLGAILGTLMKTCDRQQREVTSEENRQCNNGGTANICPRL
jgi:hypothetical protein